MIGVELATAVWFWGTLQLLGLVSAWFARRSEGKPYQTSCYWAFFTCLALVGMSTVAAFFVGPGLSLVSGTTLAVMAVGATIDFGEARRAAA